MGPTSTFVAFSRYTRLGIDGQVISLFVIVLAAAEAAVALAIVLNFYNNHCRSTSIGATSCRANRIGPS